MGISVRLTGSHGIVAVRPQPASRVNVTPEGQLPAYKLINLQDVDGSALANGRYLRWDETKQKFVFDNVAATGSTGGSGTGNGNVLATSTSTANNIVLYRDSTGQNIKDSGVQLTEFAPNSAFTKANLACTQSDAAGTQANNAYGFANTLPATIATAYTAANTASDRANIVFGYTNASSNQANTARDKANLACTQSDTAGSQANVAYGQANTARDSANQAGVQANNAYGFANTLPATIAVAYGQANNAYNQANLARDQANTARNEANGDVQTAFVTVNTPANNLISTSNADTLIVRGGNNIIIQGNTGNNTLIISDDTRNEIAAFSKANTACTQSDQAGVQANNAYGFANTLPATIATAYAAANTASDRANTVFGYTNAASNQANTARDKANTACTQSDAAGTQANVAYGQANNAYNQANVSNNTPIYKNAAFVGSRNIINFVEGSNVTFSIVDAGAGPNMINVTINASAGGAAGSPGPAFDQANTAYAQANAAFNQANTARDGANGAGAVANTMMPLRTSAVTVSANGTTIDHATILVGNHSFQLVTNAITDLAGVKLPIGNTYSIVTVRNQGNNVIKIYPPVNPTSGVIDNATVNTAVTLSIGDTISFYGISANSYYSMRGENVTREQIQSDTINAAFLKANTACTQSDQAGIQANNAYGFANTLPATIATAYAAANTASDRANTVFGYTNAASNQANTARDKANTACTQSDQAGTNANNAYGFANTLPATIATAYAQANSAFNQANIARDSANTAGSIANTVGLTANAAMPVRTSATTVSANGTTIDHATVLVGNHSFQLVTNAITDLAGVKLPIGNTYSIVTIRNQGNNTIKVYPPVNPTSGVIDNAAINVAITIPIGDTVEFIGLNANTWYTMRGENVTRINVISDTLNAAFSKANTACTQSDQAGVQANNAYGFANTLPATIATAYAAANTASDRANTVFGYTNAASVQANTARDKANTACTQSDAAGTQANNAYGFANTLPATIATAYAAANTASDRANNVYAATNTVYNFANTLMPLRTSSTTVSANGTTIDHATILVGNHSFQLVTNAITDLSGIRLPIGNTYSIVTVRNQGNNVIKIYPPVNPTSGVIDNAAVNTAVTLSMGDTITFYGINANSYYSMRGENVTREQIQSDTLNAAFSKANTACTQSDSAGAQANVAYGQANTARDSANQAGVQANNAYGFANTLPATIATAYAAANTASDRANTAYAAANTASDRANNVYAATNTVYNFANTLMPLRTSATTVSANGTTIDHATILVGNHSFQLVTNAITDLAGVKLPIGNTFSIVTVRNQGNNVIKIYPPVNPTSGQIDNATINTAVTLSMGDTITFFGINANNWYSMRGENVTREQIQSDTINAAFLKANTACTQSDQAGVQANNAYGFANTLPATIATAYAAANTASDRANNVYAATNTVYNFANTLMPLRTSSVTVSANGTTIDHATILVGNFSFQLVTNAITDLAGVKLPIANTYSIVTVRNQGNNVIKIYPPVNPTSGVIDNAAVNTAVTLSMGDTITFYGINANSYYSIRGENVTREQIQSDTINAAFLKANTACTQSDQAGVQANNAYGFANTLPATIATAYAAANTASDRANTAYAAANTASDRANNVYAATNTVYNFANTLMPLRTTVTGVSANGTTIDHATVLVGNHSFQFVSNAITDLSGIKLPIGNTFSVVTVRNQGNNVIKIYPPVNPTSGVIDNAAVNTAVTLSMGDTITFFGINANTWYSMRGENATREQVQSDTINAAFLKANTACTQSDQAGTQANNAYGFANTLPATIATAYAAANTASDRANTAYGQANNAYNQANTSNSVTVMADATTVGRRTKLNFQNSAGATVVAVDGGSGPDMINVSFSITAGGGNVSGQSPTTSGNIAIFNDGAGTKIKDSQNSIDYVIQTIGSAYAKANTGGGGNFGTSNVGLFYHALYGGI